MDFQRWPALFHNLAAHVQDVECGGFNQIVEERIKEIAQFTALGKD